MGPELEAYLATVLDELREALGPDLTALILTGSAAFGDLGPASDVDLIAVSAEQLAESRLRSVAARLSHERIPCPARQLELVLYPEAVVASPAGQPRFSLNLNTGRDRPDHVGVDPDAEASHWFVIDLSIARQAGVALAGPPPADLIGEPPPELLAEALAQSIDWHERHAGPTPSALLNACRAWHFSHTGEWSSKPDAGGWVVARTHGAARHSVEYALAARLQGSEEPLPQEAARELIRSAKEGLARAG